MIKIDRKLSLIDIVLGIIWLYTIGMLTVQYTLNNRNNFYIETLQRDNYLNIAKALIAYKNEYKKFPDMANWYSVLLGKYGYLSKNNFMRYNIEPGYSVALNKEMANAQDVILDTVLIFSSFGKENLSGDKDVLQRYIESYSVGWFITVEGDFFKYDKRYDCFVNDDGEKRLTIDEVLFK